MVENIDEQRQFEQQWINDLKPTLNTIKAFATEEDNKESNRRAKQNPEYKAKQKEYMKAYDQTPEAKARIKEHNSKPESKAKKREFQKKVHRICICGKGYRTTPSDAQQHFSSQHHRQHVERVFLRLSNSIHQHPEQTCETQSFAFDDYRSYLSATPCIEI
jgi:hypothetical protein